jgi:hypothetical protein
MRYIQVSFVAAMLLTSVQSFAHEGHGPCASYEATCKSDPSVTGATDKKAKWGAMHSCVAAAAKADTANGQKCTDMMAKHHHDHMGTMNKEAAPAATPAAPAGN